MNAALPRAVIVTRPTPLEHLLQRLSTRGQVRFFLESQGRSLQDYERADQLRDNALATVQAALPADQPRTRVGRGELERFVFRDDDLVVVVGQDGLVANVAKYLHGQAVIGVNPDPRTFDGVLCRHAPEGFAEVLAWTRIRDSRYRLQRRTMAQAQREDGQRMTALNEFYLGSRSHQSARYVLSVEGREEHHSSSGVLVATGTGATGWGLSVARQRGLEGLLPQPEQRALAWFVREPFPSVSTGVSLDSGAVGDEALEAVSEMGEGGVIFADGIESDCMEFLEGHKASISIADETLNLVVAGDG